MTTPFQKKVAAAVESLGARRTHRVEFTGHELAAEIARMEGRPALHLRAVDYRSIQALGEQGVAWRCDVAVSWSSSSRTVAQVFALNPHFNGGV